jgi:hypothetical protein
LLDYFNPSTFPNTLRIGNTALVSHAPSVPELVPFGIAPLAPVFTQPVLETLRWMMQKDALGQDMFLLSAPGVTARHMAFLYCQLAARECLMVSLTPDSTEADLKQRREIVHKSLHFTDSPTVRAAVGGYVLVLEGLELAERGVVTVLNNLLEVMSCCMYHC